MSLAEFLLARIGEDESYAEHAKWAMQGEWFATADDKVDEFVRHMSPTRVLAECEAKREAIEAAWADHLRIEGEWGNCRSRDELSAVNDYPDVLRALALPYADHPDYRQGWRP